MHPIVAQAVALGAELRALDAEGQDVNPQLHARYHALLDGLRLISYQHAELSKATMLLSQDIEGLLDINRDLTTVVQVLSDKVRKLEAHNA